MLCGSGNSMVVMLTMVCGQNISAMLALIAAGETLGITLLNNVSSTEHRNQNHFGVSAVKPVDGLDDAAGCVLIEA